MDEGARVLADGDDVVNGYNFQVASDSALDDEATKAALADYLERITEAQLWAGEAPGGVGPGVGRADRPDPTKVTLAAAQQRPATVIPIDQTVIDSEQEMADAFVENGLLPDEVDVDGLLHRRVQRRLDRPAADRGVSMTACDAALVPAHLRRQPVPGRRRPGRARRRRTGLARRCRAASAPPTIDYLAQVARTAEQARASRAC